MPILTFGKYKGYDFSDPRVETSYLQWLEINAIGVTRDMAAAELKRRSEGGGTANKLSKGEFAEKLMGLIMKMPEGLKEQTVQANGYEITIKKIF